jgi:phosphatidylinositol glycan class M
MTSWTFLYETHLYHLVRKDNRHNFSVYFYLTGSQPSAVTAFDLLFKILLDFGPQLALLLSITFTYYKDISFCILLQTMTFVAFNKVCTVQYFSLLSLANYASLKVIIATSKISKK